MADILYPYAVGRIRAIENNMLKPRDFEALISAEDANEAMRRLREFSYGSGEVHDATDFEAVLAEEEKKLLDLMDELFDGNGAVSVFTCKNEYFAAKDALKKKFSQGLECEISGSERLVDAAARAEKEYLKSRDPQVIDVILDNAAFEEMAQRAAAEGEFTRTIVAKLADLANIKTLLRVRNMNRGAAYLSRALVSGGKIEKEAFSQMLEIPRDEIKKRLPDEYAPLIDAKSFTELEKTEDNIIINHLKGAKYYPVTKEPVIGYYLAKMTEIKQVRMIMAGKLAGLSAGALNERLRESYA